MSEVTIETGAGGEGAGEGAAIETGKAIATAEIAREENAETEASLESLAAQVATLQASIADLYSRPSASYDELNALKTRVQELEAQLEAAEEDEIDEAAAAGAVAGALVAEEIIEAPKPAEETEEPKPGDQPEERKPRRKRRFIGD